MQEHLGEGADLSVHFGACNVCTHLLDWKLQN